MEKRDARKLVPQAQEEIRRQAIKMLKAGNTQQSVADELEVSRVIVGRWWKRYRAEGMKSMKPRKRGLPVGKNRKLTAEQEKEVQQFIVDKNPDQLKLSFALWNREAVRELIEDRYGITYSLQAISVILARWGFTPQRPVKAAYEQQPEQVRQWLDEEYPKVKNKAKQEGAEIWWADETAVKPECHHRRSYAPQGKTPVIKQPAKRFHASMISAINNQGKMEWMPLKEGMDTDAFLKFLRQMIKNRKHKIIVIVDNLKAHRSHEVRSWLKKMKHRIEVVYLPPYSPELNPDEYLNHNIKQNVFENGMAKTKEELEAKLSVRMFLISISKELIRSFFKHPKVQYAA